MRCYLIGLLALIALRVNAMYEIKMEQGCVVIYIIKNTNILPGKKIENYRTINTYTLWLCWSQLVPDDSAVRECSVEPLSIKEKNN